MILDGRTGTSNTTDHANEISQRQAALAAGFGLLIMFFAAMFANFFVMESIVVPGDAVATAVNIQTNESLFRFAIVAFIIVLICDILVSWGLYVFLKPVNEGLSLLTAWMRLVYTAIFTAAVFNLAQALHLVSGAAYLTQIENELVAVQAMQAIEAFNSGWLIGLVFFGIHLILLGYLAYKAEFVPKILGILLLIASIGYIFDSLALILFPNYADFQTKILVFIAIPMTLGELALCVWLLVKGGKSPKRSYDEGPMTNDQNVVARNR